MAISASGEKLLQETTTTFTYNTYFTNWSISWNFLTSDLEVLRTRMHA